MSLKQELENRWFVYQYTDDKLFDEFNKGNRKFYLWIDPSADSLQLWNLVPIMAAVNFIKYWNKLVLIVWWATGMIWDPSWKDKERQMKPQEEINENAKRIYNQLLDIFGRLKNLYKEYTWQDIKEFEEVKMINNYEFYKNMSVLDFLREIWKYITVNQMMAKESVKRRLEDPDKWISYTEFSYMLLQWYDFYKLYSEEDVKLQIWWSDQWGNIVTWIELIKKKLWKVDARGMTVPLLTTSDGKKFWKSEWNAIWLDATKNSPYYVYQYFINTSDSDVEKFLKILTLLPLYKISDIVNKHFEKPENRYGQKMLAFEIVKFLFWEKQAKVAQKISEILFWKIDDMIWNISKKIEILKNLDDEELNIVFREIWGIKFSGEKDLLDYMVESWLVKSKSEWRRFIKDWAIYLNEVKITDDKMKFNKDNLLNDKIALLRKGKKNYKLIVNF